MSLNVAIYCSNVAGQWIGSFAHCYDHARVFSPYITSSLAERALKGSTPRWIEVYTRFEIEAFAAGASSLSTLRMLKKKGYPLFHVPRLHAKVFDHPRDFATVGSQNLTQRGTRNREATILIRDPELLAQLRRQLARWALAGQPITMQMIRDAEAAIVLLRKEFQNLQRSCRKIEQRVFSAQSARDDRRSLVNEQRETELRAYQQERQTRLDRMGDGTSVPYDFCRQVAWNATEWLRQGTFVRPRRLADHLRKGLYGWELPLGENRFAVELAVLMCRAKLTEIFSPETPRSFSLTPDETTNLQGMVPYSVIGHGDKRYKNGYKVDDGRMRFGTHRVNLANTVAAILHFSESERSA